MRTTRLGQTGLEVSRICFGCMSFGKVTDERPWVLGLEEARPIFRRAWEAGINFFDTANVYAQGTSEEITGALIKELAPRDEIVLATKVFGRMRPGPNGQGLSRKAIVSEIDNSLRRLGTDYVDLYQIHRFDPFTPVEETMEALNDVVRAGKARYIGASSMWAWQFAKLQHAAKTNGWTSFISMQNQVSLSYREEEREMIPLCIDQGVALRRTRSKSARSRESAGPISSSYICSASDNSVLAASEARWLDWSSSAPTNVGITSNSRSQRMASQPLAQAFASPLTTASRRACERWPGCD